MINSGFVLNSLARLNLARSSKDPLILHIAPESDLNLTPLAANSPAYDLNGSGFSNRTAWVGSGSGLLVQVDGAGDTHLFTGNQAGGSGFGQLALLDTNCDGVIDASDPAFATMGVWQDANGNGTVEPGEIQSLFDLGIQSLSLTYASASQTISGSEVVGIGSVTMTDGTTRELAEVNLETSPTYTQADVLPDIPDAIAAMPQLHGYGTVMDLHSQMALDPTLQGLVTSFPALVASGSTADLRTATDAILFRWAGVDGVDPSGRGGLMDARRLEFLERFLGQPLTFPNGNYGNPSNPGLAPSLATNNAFIAIENGALARLLIQASPTIGAGFSYDPVHDTVAPTSDLLTSLQGLGTELGAITGQSLNVWEQVGVVLNAYQADYGIDQVAFSNVLGVIGTPGLDVIESAVSQSLAISVDAAGTLTVDNSPSDGFLLAGYGRQFGLTMAWTPTDGNLTVNFSEPTWLFGNDGNVGNTLDLNGTPEEYSLAINASGDEILTDVFTGSTLTLVGEAVTTDGNEHGIQTVAFADGTTWSMEDTFVLSYGNGHASHDVAGGYYSLRIGAGISASDVTFQSNDAGDLTVSLDGDPSDSITFQGDLFSFFGVRTHVQTVFFGDGTSLDLTQPLTFTWAGDGTRTTLNGSGWGANTFVLGNGVTTVNAGTGTHEGSSWNLFQGAAGDGATTVNLNGAGGELDLSGVTAADVTLQSDDAGDLTVSLAGSPSDSVTFRGDLYDWFGLRSRVQTVGFDDGTSLDLNQPLTYTWAGDGTQTTLTGSGWGGNVFDLGNGVTDVQPGNGSREGSSWNVFRFGAGDGSATVHFNNGGAGELDLAGVNAGGIVLGADDAGDLTVSLAGDPADSVTFDGDLSNWFGVRTHLQTIRFGDGTSLDLTQSLSFTWAGTGTQATLTGSGWGANTFLLGNGVTTVQAGNGNRGGSSWNLFDFAAGDGHTDVALNGGAGALDIAGTNAAGVTLQADDAGDLTVSLTGSPSDSVTFDGDLSNWFGVRTQIQSVRFGDGTSLDLTQSLGFTWTGDGTGTTLNGSGWGSNTFLLGNGVTTVNAGNGSRGGSSYNDFQYAARCRRCARWCWTRSRCVGSASGLGG